MLINVPAQKCGSAITVQRYLQDSEHIIRNE